MPVARRTSRDIRSESRLIVVRALLAAGETTRNELADDTGLSAATVSTVVGDLLKYGIAAETGLLSSGIGRPTTGLRLNADRGLVAGVYVEDRYFQATVFDTSLKRLANVRIRATEPVGTADAVIEWTARILDAALGDAGAAREDLLGVGVLLPGGMQRPVKSAFASDAIWLHLDRLRDRLGLPVVVDNPLKAVATAELWLGAGRRFADLVVVNLGEGVGAGIVQDGAVLRGATGTAGEWGHSLLVFEGRECQCGRRGCVEAYVGVPGIRRTLAETEPGHPIADVQGGKFVEALGEAADAGDAAALAAVDRTAQFLGAALADLVAIVNPEHLALAGWTTFPLGERLLPAVRERVRADAPGDAAAELGIELSRSSGMEGIAAVALERFMRDVGLVTTRVLPAL
ncbi:ROK family protein [Glycomyces mayteni]|uniref:ROK family protein n=1 Tax=Glycomyces mayteni TaxID=543887 RepID=A0ABW2D8J1_9ACTN|nr:ROK family transcriptional regulator [Glycomyces mayteni]